MLIKCDKYTKRLIKTIRQEVYEMDVNYNKLFKLLIDKDLKRLSLLSRWE